MQDTAIIHEPMLQVIGHPIRRPDVLQKAMGISRYAGDLTRPNMLHAATVRSPVARLTELRLNAEPAMKIQGFVRFATALDIPGSNRVPLVMNDQPFLAETETRFHGEAVGLVASETWLGAVLGASAVEVTGNSHTPCIDPLAALHPGTHRIHPDDNIFKSYHIERGDFEQHWGKDAVRIEAVYRTPHQEHGYLEPQGMLAEPDDDGGIRIEGSMQCPFYVQDAVAAILGLPKNKVVVVQSTTGGGFGGKEDVPSIVAGHAALLAWLTRRPVRLIYSREEDFRAMSKRHPSITRIRISAQPDGTFLAIDVDYILNGGAYATLSPIVLWRGSVHAAGPYRWKAVRIHSRAVATNTVPCGAFRGFGQPQITFALESAIDELASKLGMDPFELRRKNAIGLNDQTATGHIIQESCGLEEVMMKGSEIFGWPLKHSDRTDVPEVAGFKKRGVGCSASFYGVGLGAGGQPLARAGAYVQIEDDGSVRVFIGNTEMGQGALGVVSQIAAETLNTTTENIRTSPADTSRVPDSGPTVASRTTVMSGRAVMDACLKIKKSLLAAAAGHLQCVPEDIIMIPSGFRHPSDASRSVSYLDTVRLAKSARLPLAASGWFIAPPTSFGENGQGNAYMTYVWSANFVMVEVDPDTMEVDILRIVAAHDVGKAINPREVGTQIQGGVLQGLGFALTENITYNENGIMMNPNFSGYIMPTPADASRITPVIVEHPFSEGPFGAKGIGEPPLIGVAPAVANAVFSAIGVRVRELPLCPEKILNSLQEIS